MEEYFNFPDFLLINIPREKKYLDNWFQFLFSSYPARSLCIPYVQFLLRTILEILKYFQDLQWELQEMQWE